MCERVCSCWCQFCLQLKPIGVAALAWAGLLSGTQRCGEKRGAPRRCPAANAEVFNGVINTCRYDDRYGCYHWRQMDCVEWRCTDMDSNARDTDPTTISCILMHMAFLLNQCLYFVISSAVYWCGYQQILKGDISLFKPITQLIVQKVVPVRPEF